MGSSAVAVIIDKGWARIGVLGFWLLGTPASVKPVLTVRPTKQQALGLSTAAVTTGATKWNGVTALEFLLYGAA